MDALSSVGFYAARAAIAWMAVGSAFTLLVLVHIARHERRGRWRRWWRPLGE